MPLGHQRLLDTPTHFAAISPRTLDANRWRPTSTTVPIENRARVSLTTSSSPGRRTTGTRDGKCCDGDFDVLQVLRAHDRHGASERQSQAPEDRPILWVREEYGSLIEAADRQSSVVSSHTPPVA